MEPDPILIFHGKEQESQAMTRWLVDRCDTVVWSNYGRRSLFPGFWQPWERDPGFEAAVSEMGEALVDSYCDRIEYGHIPHPRRTFRHFRFRLTGEVRTALLRGGFLLSFPGLWDPCYYRRNELVAAAICHEGSLLLWDDPPIGSAALPDGMLS